jgi:hypothetical protein
MRLALAFAALIVTAAAAAADEGWLIERFAIRLEIRPDGSMVAREAIDVDFRGQSRHGIYRDIVSRLEYDATRDREYDIRLTGVTAANGRSHQVQSITDGPLQRFRIGDPDVTISGKETYRLVYGIDHALNAFAEHDELYWNASGTWPVTANDVSVTVSAPPGSIVRVDCFQGYAGSTERCDSRFTPDEATFRATRPLRENEQLTIVTALEKGAVADPRPRLVRRPRGIFDSFERTPALVGGMAAELVVLLGAIGAAWWRIGRDRRYVSLHYLSQDKREEIVPPFDADAIAVEFEPPDRMRPGQMGLLLDERADTLDVTATIVDLAVRGYLKITEIPRQGWFGRTDWQLTRLKQADANLLAYEEIVLDGLFGTLPTRNVSDLKNKFYEDLSKAKSALYADGLARKWFPMNPQTIRTGAVAAGVLVAGMGVALTLFLGRQFGAGLLGLPVIVGGLLLTMLSRAMPRRSAAGREAMRRVLGFARYITTAETHQQAFAERAQIFTSYLPYAIAFKCVDRWARAFSDIDLTAATAGWYAGNTHFDPGGFSTTLGSFSSSVSSTLASTPGGSGSSGFSGGSSGGGGGGGGGGSW